MSIDSLLKADFKHRFQDDMESFYYVVLYSSALWLPHEESDNDKEHISKFFDEHEVFNGRLEGGTLKFLNRKLGKFETSWGFKNELLREWLTRVRQLQLPYQTQPNWNPTSLHNVWLSIDRSNLPTDDRKEHIQGIHWQPSAATQASARSIGKGSQKANDSVPVDMTPGTSSKQRNREAEVGLKAYSDILKRQRN